MENICDMNINYINTKEGDVKVDIKELRALLNCIGNYHTVLSNMLENLDDKEVTGLTNGIEYVEYFQNKYIVLAGLRKEQADWYKRLKNIEKNGNKEKEMSAEEFEKLKTDAFELYLTAKDKREKLDKECEAWRKEHSQLVEYFG